MLIRVIYIYPENLLPLNSVTPAQNVQVFVKAEILELKFLLKKTTQAAEGKYLVLVPSLQNVKAYWVVDVKLLMLLTASSVVLYD
jgi:hypothetical protein